MRVHTQIPSLRYRGTGSTVYLEIGFDARPEHCPGAQWITIQLRADIASSTQTVCILPRDLMKEQVVRIGKVRRLVTVEADPSSSTRRRIGLSLATNSPYCLIRHTRREDGGVQDEEIFPFITEPEEPQVTSHDLWSSA
jgi:hypothetical protein